MPANDIISYNGELWLSREFILNKGVVKDSYLRVARSRAAKGARSWRNQVIANKTYFSLESIPASNLATLGTMADLINRAVVVKNEVEEIISNSLYSTFKQFIKYYPADDRNQSAAKSAALLHEAAKYCLNVDQNFSKSPFFRDLAQQVALNSFKYLPTSWRNLRDRIRDLAQGKPINELVKPFNLGNQNRAILKGNELLEAWLIDLGRSQKNYTSATIHRKVETLCIQHDITKIPSYRWVTDFISSKQTQNLIHERWGQNSRFNSRYRVYAPMQSALYAGDCWDIDGTRVNIIDHKATTLVDGKKITSNKFLYIIAVRDVHSGLPIGWEYCYEESADAIINALTMAVRNTGYLPYEIRYDRFPGHNTDKWAWVELNLQKRGVTMTQTINPNAKSIERWFGTLQSVFMSQSDLYYGEGVKSSRRYAHRSKEYINEMRIQAAKHNFNFDMAVAETDRIIDAFCTTKLSYYSRKYKKIDKTPVDLHNDSDKANVTPVTDSDFALIFGLRKQVSIRNNMIHTQIAGASYYYGIDDCDVIDRFTGEKLINCFDFDNLDVVHLFDDSHNYLGSFDRINPGQQFGPDKDMASVGKVKSIAEKMAKHRAEKLDNLASIKDMASCTSPELGTLLAGKIKKEDYEQAETNHLLQQWGDEEGDNILINTRKSY